MLTATIKICECTKYHTHPDDPSYEICKCGGHFRAKTYTLNQVKKLWNKSTRNIEMVFGEHAVMMWRHRYTGKTALVDVEDKPGIAWIQRVMDNRANRKSTKDSKDIVL